MNFFTKEIAINLVLLYIKWPYRSQKLKKKREKKWRKNSQNLDFQPFWGSLGRFFKKVSDLLHFVLFVELCDPCGHFEYNKPGDLKYVLSFSPKTIFLFYISFWVDDFYSIYIRPDFSRMFSNHKSELLNWDYNGCFNLPIRPPPPVWQMTQV